MQLDSYQVRLLFAVYKRDFATLRQEYLKDGEKYVYSMYSLYQLGLLNTFQRNFVYGGDKVEPEDVVVPEDFHISAYGKIILFNISLDNFQCIIGKFVISIFNIIN